MGEGFYFSLVYLNNTKEDKFLKVSVTAQKEHNWIFRLPLIDAPMQVLGTDDWFFDSTRNELNIRKSGKTFELTAELN